MNDNNNSSRGIGFTGFLTLLFIALKLLGKIDWSWWWVLSPIWITTLIVIGIVLIWLIVNLIKDYIRRKKLIKRFKEFQESIGKVKESE